VKDVQTLRLRVKDELAKHMCRHDSTYLEYEKVRETCEKLFIYTIAQQTNEILGDDDDDDDDETDAVANYYDYIGLLSMSSCNIIVSITF